MTLKLMLAAILALPVFAEDVDSPAKAAQLEAVAAGIAQASVDRPKPARDWAALLLTVGYHESGFSLRILNNQCKRFECDPAVVDGVRIFRARGVFQTHRNKHNEQYWDALPGNPVLQAKVASDMLARAYWNCARSGVPWTQATLSSYAGRRCDAEWPGLQQRLATFARVRARLG